MGKGAGTPVVASPSRDRADLLWRQYHLHVDLYKFYLELVLKANAFFYGITGALVSYYFANVTEPRIRLALGLPLLMSIALTGLYLYGAVLLRPVRNEMFRIRDELQLENAPDVMVLIVMLCSFGMLTLVAAIGLVALAAGY